MKLLCIVSHRISGEEGKYTEFIAGKVYDLPASEEPDPNFVPAPQEEDKN